MRKSLLGVLLTACMAAQAEYSSYFYWQVDDSVADFSYAQLRLSGGSTYFKIGDTAYTKVGAETTGGSELGNHTLAVTANLGAYASSEYSFLVEVFGEDDGLLAFSDTFSYDDIASLYVYSDMSSALSGTAYGVSVSNVPEPTSGVMMLLGLALLGLRRKRGGHGVTRPTQHGRDGVPSPSARCAVAGGTATLPLLPLLFFPVCLFAAANDIVLTFSTPGPDTYADGMTVLDGESYALVWTKNGASFGGIAADGKLLSATDKLVLVAGVAEDGKCPTTVFEIEAADYAAYEGGSFALYLLDTRVKDAEGKVTVAGANALALAAPESVNAIGLASTATASSSTATSSLNLAPAQSVALGSVGVQAKIDAPQITALKIEGETVAITVNKTSPTADYFVVPGTTPGSFATALDAKQVDGTFTFQKPKDAAFFKVIGVRKFE